MSTLQNIDFTKHKLPSSDLEILNIKQESFFDFDSFCNSFFESYWHKFTDIKEVYLSLKVKGDGEITIIRKYEDSTEEIVSNLSFQFDDYSACTLIAPLGEATKASRLSFKVKSRKGFIHIDENGAYWGTKEEPKNQNICLGIVFCTFNREEYLLKNLEKIKNSEIFKNYKSHLYVVDNASNLNLSSTDRVHYIPQENLGGAGGFSRGLYECRKNQNLTHVVFMDDDVEVDTETFFRTQKWFEFSHKNTALCGAMLNLFKPHEMWEQGALFKGPVNISIKALNHDLNINSEEGLRELNAVKNVEYGAWWYFSFPLSSIKESLPLPFFIKGDDIEFGTRLTKLGVKIASLPGIWLYHEPFNLKVSSWVVFYDLRNRLHTLLYTANIARWFGITKDLIKYFYAKALTYSYDQAYAIVYAIEKSMEGPFSLKSQSTSIGNQKISNALKKYQYSTIINSEDSPVENKKLSLLNTFFNIITIRGHLIPTFLCPKKESIYKVRSVKNVFSSIFSQELHYIGEYKTEINTKNNILFFKLQILFILRIIQLLIKLPRLRREWKDSFPYLTSEKSWIENFWKPSLKRQGIH